MYSLRAVTPLVLISDDVINHQAPTNRLKLNANAAIESEAQLTLKVHRFSNFDKFEIVTEYWTISYILSSLFFKEDIA